MIAGRLRECLKVLRWSSGDLAETLHCRGSEVEGWLDGRRKVPIAVVAWLEALVRAHQALPPPSLLPQQGVASAAGDANASAPSQDRRARPSVASPQIPYLRRNLVAGTTVAMDTSYNFERIGQWITRALESLSRS